MNTQEKYREAIEMYRDTSLSITAICRRCGVGRNAFSKYIAKYHRDLMFRRRGIEVSPLEAVNTKICKPKGQREASRKKYGKAIEACDNDDYIRYNVSEIARIFNVSIVGLGQQLRSHFPDILKRREEKRRSLGIADNYHRGAKYQSHAQYAAAVEYLRNSDATILQTAERHKVSFTGLRQYLLFYHKDLVENREHRRQLAKSRPKQIGKLTGSGTLHIPKKEYAERYGPAVKIYSESAMTLRESAEVAGISLSGLRNHLRIWYRNLMPGSHTALRSTAAKYAPAIAMLKEGGATAAEVARHFGLNPDVFRQYLHEHEPALAAKGGMGVAPDGRRFSNRCAEKYAEAIAAYASTDEPLKSIASRLGLTYKSLSSYVRRNHPDLIARHNAIAGDKESQ